MVTSVTSFGRSGVYAWMVQRVSAVVMLIYLLFVAGVCLLTPDLQYSDWRALFGNDAMRFFSLFTLLALCAHGWIGMWTISTDYLTPFMLGRAAFAVRFLFQLACLAVLFVYLAWGIQILWSI